MRRFTLTNGWRCYVGISSSRLVIASMSKPIVYGSWASSSMQLFGPHWTRNSSTYVERMLCLIRRGSVRARTLRMDALPPRASLPLRGSVIDACFRFEGWVCLDPVFLLFLKCRAIRVPSLVVGWVGGGGTFRKASIIVGCRDALLSARGECLSGRVSHADEKMFLHLGAMEESMTSSPASFLFFIRQSSHPEDAVVPERS